MTKDEAGKGLCALLGVIMQMSDDAEKLGGATSISGVASLHRLQTSLQKNGPRMAKLVAAYLETAVTVAPCGYSEPESTYRDPDTGAHRTAKCEGGGRMVVRGNLLDSVTDGTQFISSRSCPKCSKPL